MNTLRSTQLNNFDALRLFAAYSVLVSHQYALSGLSEPIVFGSMSLGLLGLLIFFSISGFLVSQSWRQDPHIARFLAKRLLRIWPALAAFTLLAALVFGPIVSTLNWQAYFHEPEFYAFFKTLNLVSTGYNLPGVFESNIYPKTVNGSLWTIPIEVACYLALLFVAIMGLTKFPFVVAIVTSILVIYSLGFAPNPAHHKFHFGLLFFSGVCLDLFRKNWESRPTQFMAVMCLISGALFALDVTLVALALLIASVSVFIGSRSTPVLSRVGRYGDISYGIYVYAFTVQQTVLWVVGKEFSFLMGLLIATVITTLFAFLSWHLVESPALSLKARLNGSPSSITHWPERRL
jgi:peptidoglycan/LPS O-acetylase OafA/YrhL